MLTLLYAYTDRGFSLIELLIGIAVLGTLLAFGFPAFNTYAQNARILTSAQSFQASVSQARAEAVRLNANVELVLTDDIDPTTTNLSVNGRNTLVRTKPKGAPGYVLVDLRDGREGSGQATGSTPRVLVTGSVNQIVFSPLSNTALTSSATFSFTSQADGPKCVKDGGTARCLTVEVSPGGQSRLCDPKITVVSDSRACSNAAVST
jgi:type IV fimbrial biogenesis protein FimT